MSDSEISLTPSAERDLTLDIIRDPGVYGDWLNRFCRNADTHVLTSLSIRLTLLRKSSITAMSLMTRSSKFIVETNMVPLSPSQNDAARISVLPTSSSPSLGHLPAQPTFITMKTQRGRISSRMDADIIGMDGQSL